DGVVVGVIGVEGEMEREEKNLSHTMEIQRCDDEAIRDEGASRFRYVTYEEFDSLSRSVDTLTTSVAGLHTKLDDMMAFMNSILGTPPPSPPPPSDIVYRLDNPVDDTFMEF
ncbi:unnamed protein product, partial [Ilex paraguariensis]